MRQTLEALSILMFLIVFTAVVLGLAIRVAMPDPVAQNPPESLQVIEITQ